jgi:hypothetical protein
MRFYKSIPSTKEVESRIVCNKCGYVIEVEKISPLEDWIYMNTIHSFHIRFEYGSKYDGYEYKFDLCDECLAKFIKSFEVEAEDIPNF